MFFLKEMPTQAMINRYCDKFFPGQAQDISNTLKALREHSSLLRKLDDYFASNNLSQLRFLILMVIDRELDRNCLYAYEIAEKLDVSKPVLSRAIKRLIEDSLLISTKDFKDARAILLSLTPKSKELLKSILPEYFHILSCKQTSERT